MIARDIIMAEYLNIPIHICHVSTKGGVRMVREAKARGVKVTCETCPHYFTLTDDCCETYDSNFKMHPPLRTKEHVDAIIEGIKDGTIDAIATDHAPHSPEEKADFVKAPNGVVGMETSLAATLTYMGDKLSLSDIARLMSTNPAGIMGIPAGEVKAGAPADCVLVDLHEKWTVDPDRLHGRSKNAVFKGETLTGRVKATFCGGKNVF